MQKDQNTKQFFLNDDSPFVPTFIFGTRTYEVPTFTMYGDSGSPIWVIDQANDEQATIVSIVQGGDLELIAAITRGRERRPGSCGMIHTKITEEIMEWIKTSADITD